jgi:hypothetical protein
MRRTWIAVLVVAVAGLAAGCGGSDNSSEVSPTDEWASGFCTAITDWTTSLQDVSSQFSDTSNLSTDGLKSAADDVRSATDTLVSDLGDLGAPDTESGDQVKSSLDSLSSTLDDEVNTIQNAAQGVSNLTQLPGAISTISESLSALGNAFSNTLNTIDNADASGELQKALEDSPECAPLVSNNGQATGTTTETEPDTTVVHFTVTGYAPKGVDITYGNDSSNYQGRLPLDKSLRINSDALYYVVTAQLKGGGNVKCTITIGDETRVGHAVGGYNICSAQLNSDPSGGWH